jgi:DNA (cytosine-5)-methyltransferase 1
MKHHSEGAANCPANDNSRGAFYNENDKFAAQWLRNLIDAGHIAPGVVDERSIVDIRPSDLEGYTQCHFFAGIGVWSAALRSAGWPDNRRIWTASCPCQPFSAAGKGGGFDDERHLWPALQWLAQQCRPDILIGEQVASKDGLAWFDLVSTDLEAMGYAVGAVPFPVAGLGAPHIRQRLYWVADADCERRYGFDTLLQQRRQNKDSAKASGSCKAGVAQGDASDSRLALGSVAEIERRPLRVEGTAIGATSAVRGFWAGADWIWCRDGKYRPVEPGTFPLAHGATARVGKLRAYGNAIVKQQAQAFIEAYCEVVAANDNTEPMERAA